jgi:hypothetical protein
MESDFWVNLDTARATAGIERKAIEKECGLSNNAFTHGLERKSSPSVDRAYCMARSVGLTVEELVAGEAGADYVRAWARQDGRVWQPPAEIADLVDGLKLLSSDELVPIRGAVKALVEGKKRGERPA